MQCLPLFYKEKIMFSTKPNYQEAQKRITAFLNHEDTDRPVISLAYPKANAPEFTRKKHNSHEEYWLDFEYRVAEAVHNMENTVFCAEAMPVFMPDLGPGIISAWAGCPHSFGEHTAWTDPCLFDWENDNAIIDMAHPLSKKLEEFTRLAIEAARGKFIVGVSDFHPGGDHLSALRGPEALAIDLLEEPEKVNAKLVSSYKEYFPVFDFYKKLLKSAGMPISTWLPITCETDMYVPSNDFSCMISKNMFDEFFLPGIIDECRYYDKSIYHLDGPGAIQHLDSLLSIPELDGFQWVPGAGQEQILPWHKMFKKMLAAGKSVITYPQNMDDLRFLMDNYDPKGLYVHLWHVSNESDANDLLKVASKWK